MSAYAPVSRTTSHSRARSVPSRLTAVRRRTTTEWRVIGESGIAVDVVDDEIRLGDGAREVAPLVSIMLADVRPGDGPEAIEIAEVAGAVERRVDHGSPGCLRLLRVRRRRQLLVPDVDERERRVRPGGGVGDDGDDRLPRVTHDLASEDRLVLVGRAVGQALHGEIVGR